MAIYFVSGKLGAGKGIVSVSRIVEAVRAGRRVATNLDLTLEAVLPARIKAFDVIRLPDKPVLSDLVALGPGNPTMDEARNGLIVLDELGTWFNARSWNDKARQPVIDWLIHSRKHGWDVIFIAQSLGMVDKQVRESLVEFSVRVRRLDRLRVPVLGALVSSLTSGMLDLRLPRIHLGTVCYGAEPNAPVAERWWHRGDDVYAAYDTRQVFREDYPHGVFSYLSPWHLVGRYRLSWWARVCEWWAGGARRPVPARKSLAVDLAVVPPDLRVRVARRLLEFGYL